MLKEMLLALVAHPEFNYQQERDDILCDWARRLEEVRKARGHDVDEPGKVFRWLVAHGMWLSMLPPYGMSPYEGHPWVPLLRAEEKRLRSNILVYGYPLLRRAANAASDYSDFFPRGKYTWHFAVNEGPKQIVVQRSVIITETFGQDNFLLIQGADNPELLSQGLVRSNEQESGLRRYHCNLLGVRKSRATCLVPTGTATVEEILSLLESLPPKQ